MTPEEKKIFLSLIEEATQRMSNDSCNDFDLSKFMKPEQVLNFVKEYHDYNGDPEEFDPTHDNNFGVPDFALLTFLATKI